MCHRTNGSNNIKPLPTVNGENKKTATDNQWATTGHKPLDDKRERQDGPGGNYNYFLYVKSKTDISL